MRRVLAVGFAALLVGVLVVAAFLLTSLQTPPTHTAGSFEEVPSYQISGNGTLIPVLLMQPGTVSTVIVTFSMLVTVTPEMLNETGSMFAARYPSGIAYFGYIHQDEILPGSQPIVTMVSPLELNITNWPAGTTFNVTYRITASANSTGFYTSLILMGGCVSYPLAVGYSASQINASDIAASYPFGGCPAYAFARETVSVANMTFVSVFVPGFRAP